MKKTFKGIQTKKNQTVTYERTPIRLAADFSADTLQVEREWNDIFKTL